MPNWRAEFMKKMADYKPQDKWILTEEPESKQLQKHAGWHEYVQKRLFASFKCSSCSRSWRSAQVVIVFYMHLLRNIFAPVSGQVKMKIFRQKCRVCGNLKFEEPSFRDDTIQFVLHNLVQKILENCYGEVSRISPIREPVAEEIVEGPHEKESCEACQHGFCVGKARPMALGQVWRQEGRPVRPTSLDQPSEWEESCSNMVCVLVVGLILIIISFLLNSTH